MRLTTPVRAAVVGLAAASVVAAGGYAAGASTGAPRPGKAVANLPAPSAAPNPLIADGVSIGKNVAVYKSSGLGPGALGPVSANGTPERYVDPAQFPGGVLSPGVTITEAQSMNALARIAENLATVGLGVEDVISMRVFLDNPPGAVAADYTGWNRAYRQFFANTDRVSGGVNLVPKGTAAPALPIVTNAARPSRFTLEVASLPVAGWLVEVEVDAVFPS